MASYPGSLPSFSTKTDGVDIVDAADPNTIQAELLAVTQSVGVNPHVSTAPSSSGTFIRTSTVFSNLIARLANIEIGVVSDAHAQYVHKSGGDTVTATTGAIPLTLKPAAGAGDKSLVLTDSAGAPMAWGDVNGDLFVDGGSQVISLASLATTSTAVVFGTTSGPGNATTVARENHTHSFVANFTIPFHIANNLTTGLKVPKWIASQNCTLRFAKAALNSGSGARFQVYVNGSAAAGMVDSPTIDTTAVVTHDFTDVSVTAGQAVQINLTSAGTSASDLSITIDAVWR